MDLTKILVIAGKPDLFELVSQTKTGAVVESLVDHKRIPVFKADRISSLNEISLFTEEGDVSLKEVLRGIFAKEEGKALAFDPKKVSGKELFDYFGSVLPDYDTERVHASDVKKVLSWYNILQSAGKVDNEPDEAAEKAGESQPEGN